MGRSYLEVVGSNAIVDKFSLTRGDSQISFKKVIPKGDLVYRQYCLLPEPKHILNHNSTGATGFPFWYKGEGNWVWFGREKVLIAKQNLTLPPLFYILAQLTTYRVWAFLTCLTVWRNCYKKTTMRKFCWAKCTYMRKQIYSPSPHKSWKSVTCNILLISWFIDQKI